MIISKLSEYGLIIWGTPHCIGYTTNLHERLTSHISGNSKATEPRRPFTLLFCEYYLSKHDAARREKYFKTTVGKKTLRFILKESLAEVNHT